MSVMTAPRMFRVRPSAPAARGQGWRARGKECAYWAYLHSGWPRLRDAVSGWRGQARHVIVTYHRVGGCDVLSKPAADFREELLYFKARFEVLTLRELCGRLASGEESRRPTLTITFDDGYRDNALVAAPILEELGLRATFFVSTGYVDTDRVFPHDGRGNSAEMDHPKLTWDDLRAMQSAGHEIGSHTVEHLNMGRVDPWVVREEVQTSLAKLRDELGPQARAFSFPWGKPGDWSACSLEMIRKSGYYAAVTAYGGCNGSHSDPFLLNRVDVGNGQLGPWTVRARVAGLDPDYHRFLSQSMEGLRG